MAVSNTISRPRAVSALLTFFALVAIFITGCGPGEDTHSGISGTGGSGGQGGGGSGGGPPCSPGATRDCHITLGQHNNVLSCFDGVQTCNDGVWSACEGQSANHPKPPPPPAMACVNNPCDPTCQSFNETPATPIGSPAQNLIAPWLVGNYGGLPPNLQAEVTGEPCSDGTACQSDQYCNNPASGYCAHNKCVVGTGLQAACDPACVGKICAANPSCCTTPVPAAGCPHDLCATGQALVKTSIAAGTTACDTCVNTVCQTQWGSCCDTAVGAWTAECVDRVTTACSKSCATGSWTQSCVDLVDTYCNAKCLEDTTVPKCAHDKCLLGDGLDASCDPCVQAVCAQNGSCCSGSAGAWNGTCLQAVKTICGETCPAKGDCVPWLPTQKDAKCGGAWDLTVGVGCTDGAVQKVPVCNRGQNPSPAGLVLAVFPAAAPLYIPSIAPPIASATAILPLPAIAAGACSDVALPAGTVEGAQLVANPTTDPSYGMFGGSSECHNGNNWGVWSNATGQCAAPSCAGASAFSKLKKIKLFLSVDVSASMGRKVTDPSSFGLPSRWTYLSSALTSFMTTAPDDTGVWIRFWPNNDAAAGPCPSPGPPLFSGGCGPVPYCKNGNADVNDLTAANETSVVNAIAAVPLTGNTPMYPALDAATQKAIDFQTANPDWNAVVILVTDGNPTQCVTSASKIAALAGNAFNGYGVRTYAIGLTTDVNQSTIDLIANTGGGKGFYVDTNNNAQFQSDLAAALNSIKQDFVSCTLPLPNQDIFDPTQAVIMYTPGVGMPLALSEVADAAACAGDGWYYDNPADPTTITLCPTTCSNVKLDTNGKLELSIACIKQYLPSTYSQVYQASCPSGTTVQWGFLAYDTTTPGDSHIDFRAQASADNVTFSALQASPISRASATAPDVQVCPMGGPAPCPVDLYNALSGLPNAQQQYLKLVADIVPTTDKLQTPVINNWQVTYSCPDTE